MARSEVNLHGPVEPKRVIATFSAWAPILELHLEGGKVIKSTHEHPFWKRYGAWTAVNKLQPGDEIALRDGWIRVDKIVDNGQSAWVYNVCVDEYHTYFVGGDGWDFSVWAHNASKNIQSNAAITSTEIRSNARPMLQYMKHIEAKTGIRIPKHQRLALKQYLQQNNHELRMLTPVETDAHRWTSSKLRSLRRKWKKETGLTWPTYTQHEIDTVPNLSRREVGWHYDAHELIPNQFNAPHQWWNLVPARFPDLHQGGVHGTGSVYQIIIDRFGGKNV